jgi:uncharacterized membrane protein YjfL (UPF0719 family)
MPNLEVSGMLVEQALICFYAIRASSVTPNLAYSAISHCLQLLAFSRVSAVVKVLEFTKISVSSTLRPELQRVYLQLLC